MSLILPYLSQASGLGQSELRRLIVTAPERYKVFPIDKRSGKGVRWIAQPAREVKFLQRIFMRQFLERMPVHPCATAYRKGFSLRDNALPHAGAGPILKMDLKDFFPSIRGRDWDSYCHARGFFESREDVYLSERLLFFRPIGGRLLRLSIGAPTSPIVSNILMFDFDHAVQDAVSSDSVTYTRYADDLTFSAPRTGHLTGVQRAVARVIREMRYPKLSINKAKTTYATKKYHREITGLIISNDGRVTIGRERKRLIFAKVYSFLKGDLSDNETRRLAGVISYVRSVEPDFLDVLVRKYGDESLTEIVEYASLFKGRIAPQDAS